MTGLHTIAKATEQLICLTFEDPNEILSKEKRKIAKLLQDCYNKKDRHTYWQIISSGAEPYIPIATAGIGLDCIMNFMCVNPSVPAMAGARLVVSERGETLSPK